MSERMELLAHLYKSPVDEVSMCKGIPISYLNDVRNYFKMINPEKTVRVRFRGPRNSPTDNRPSIIRQSICLKKFAKTFAVYIDQ